MKFIQITDPHLVTPGERLFGLDPLARFEACIDSINTQHGDAEFAVITGDLADRGEPAAYAALKAALGRLRLPYHLLLGNHDDRAVFFDAFPDSPRDQDGFVQYVLETGIGRFLCLDTLETGQGWGSLCARRLAWLERELDRSDDRLVFLFMHHPPFRSGIKRMDEIALASPEHFARIVDGRRNIRHLFFGHLHRPVAGSWHGIPISTMRATAHQVALDFVIEGKVPGSHEPPAYAVVLLSGDTVVVHTHDYMDASPRFFL